MSAKDIYHDVVCDALDNDGWTITHDPLEFRIGVLLRIDLGAEKIIRAEKGSTKIAVEVKSFLNTSVLGAIY